jgi:CBS domain containing-hemolysin-like protein
MPSLEDRSSDATQSPSRRRRFERAPSWVERLLGLWRKGPSKHAGSADSASGGAEDAVADLVDQAEAFASLRVADVMTPRADIVALEISTPLSDVVRRFVEVEHSRMPIYRETLDDPVGVAHIKDLFKLIAPTEAEPERAPRTPWREPILHRLRREVLYVPASMHTAALLVRMRAARIHMAMVIDEYGGVDGVVTMEDLIEAVVGDIDDEHDEETPAPVLPRPGGCYEAEARAPLEALETLLGADLAPADAEEDIDTLGGLVVALAGRVPQRGEVIVHPRGYEFEVLDADPRRIRRLRIRPLLKDKDAAQEPSPPKGEPARETMT